MTGPQQARLTHKQFFQLCEWVKNDANLTAPTTLIDLGKIAGESLGFPISAGSVSEALEATGMKYTPIASTPRSKVQHASAPAGRSNDSIVIARQVQRLCTKLGIECDPEVIAIACTGRT